jgi:hypothetical protein
MSGMTPEMEKLLVLQDREQKHARLARELSVWPAEMKALEAKRVEIRAGAEKKRLEAQSTEVERKNLELEAATHRAKVARYKIQQFETRKNEEFSALGTEIAREEKEVHEIEDRELELMDRGEKAKKAAAIEIEAAKARASRRSASSWTSSSRRTRACPPSSGTPRTAPGWPWVLFEEKPGAPVAGAEARAEAAKVEKFQSDARKDEFSVSRLLSNAANRSVTYIVLGLLLFFACIGSSMAVNLNMYKSTPFKVLYAIYGFLFGFVVVPYVLLYRWYWQGKQPKYYGFIPFVPGFFTRPWVQFLLGWLTYKKDEHMGNTQEWIHHETK